MFAKNNKIFFVLIVLLFGYSSSRTLRDRRQVQQYLNELINKSEEPVVTSQRPETTYDWGQWTKTQDPGSRTTYDWGQHTGTQSPVSRTTYDWGQHTGSRTTYDWGQHTPTTTSPNDDNSTSIDTTDNPNNNNTNNEYRCAAGKYTCKGTIGLCINLNQICDGKQDCPHRDDEDKEVCFPGFGDKHKKKNYNSFAGTGFMFHVKNLVIREGSDVKLFDQQSDNESSKGSQIGVNKT